MIGAQELPEITAPRSCSATRAPAVIDAITRLAEVAGQPANSTGDSPIQAEDVKLVQLLPKPTRTPTNRPRPTRSRPRSRKPSRDLRATAQVVARAVSTTFNERRRRSLRWNILEHGKPYRRSASSTPYRAIVFGSRRPARTHGFASFTRG